MLIFGSPLYIFIIVLCDSLKKERKKIMETVIIVSVLSTLCVVALVGSIVVAYRKLKNKVGVDELNEYRREVDERLNNISNRIDEDVRNIYHHIDESIKNLDQRLENEMDVSGRNIDEVRKMIDSRCDKLHSLIQPDSQNKKQILKS